MNRMIVKVRWATIKGSVAQASYESDQLTSQEFEESKKDIVSRIERAVTQREWAERMAADAGPEEMPRN
jgi:hypothetical protein